MEESSQNLLENKPCPYMFLLPLSDENIALDKFKLHTFKESGNCKTNLIAKDSNLNELNTKEQLYLPVYFIPNHLLQKEDLKKYSKEHSTKETSIACQYCGKTFKTRSHLKIHLRCHTGEKPYSCEFCDKSFAENGTLKRHFRLHTGEKPYHCDFCAKSFNRLCNFNKHLKLHEERPLLSSPSVDAAGKSENCSKSVPKYSCEHCGKLFINKYYYRTHINGHLKSKIYSCPTCGKSFKTIFFMKRHIFSHTGEKPYCCDICNKRFTVKQSLVLHLRLHSGEKPYSCEFCKKRFIGYMNLRHHLVQHTGEKPYTCDICYKAFACSSNRNKHIKYHHSTNQKI